MTDLNRPALSPLTNWRPLRIGDNAIVVADFPSVATAHWIADQLRGAGCDARLFVIAAGKPFDPPALELIRSASLTVFARQVPLPPPPELLRSGRLVDLSGLSPDQMDRLFRADPNAVAKAEQELRGYFAPGAKAQMAFSEGRHFEFTIETLAEPLMAMPPGQLFAIPRQGTGRGTLVVDAADTSLHHPARPLVFKFDGGLLLEASDPSLQEALDRLGEGAKRFSAFAIGLNPNACPSGSPAEKSAVPGQLTVYLGSNRWLRGGEVDAPSWLRLCVSESCSISLDAREIPTRAVPRTLPPDPSPLPFPPVDPELYRELFEHSNDAQVILDDGTDTFLQVNAAFVRLVGYASDEIVGRMTARKLFAPESLEAYRKCRTDRFELTLLARDRAVRVVNASFRLAKLRDRRVVLGSMQDVTEQKRLQEGNWARIEELLVSNARIGILKEKLESVQEFAAVLYNIREEAAILSAAADFMRDRSRLGLAEASLYLIQDNSLVPVPPGPTRSPIGLSENESFAKVLVGDEKVLLEGDRLVTALKGMDQNLGVVEARLPAKELQILRESSAVARSYLNIFGTLANILGLSIENVRLYNRVFKESIHDPLTQIYNRRYLDAKLEEEIRRAERYGRPLSIIMIDLDEFKQINDHHPYRHRQGDVILREISAILRSTSREVDIVARYGGDEFIIVMPETHKEGAIRKAATLQRLVQETRYTDLETGRPVLTMSVSVGVAEIPHGGPAITSWELIREADRAMYQDKASRKKARSSQTKEASPP